MPRDFMTEASPIIKDYLNYLQTVKERSPKTIDEYFSDLLLFFRYIKMSRKLVSDDLPFNKIPIDDGDID